MEFQKSLRAEPGRAGRFLGPRWAGPKKFRKLGPLSTMVYFIKTWLGGTNFTVPFIVILDCNMNVCLVGSRISILGFVPGSTLWTPVLSVQSQKPCQTGTFSVSLYILIFLLLACNVDIFVSLSLYLLYVHRLLSPSLLFSKFGIILVMGCSCGPS